MPIVFDEERRIFKLDAAGSSYLIGIHEDRYLAHLYYGAYIPDDNLTDFARRHEYASFSATAPDRKDRSFSPDTCPFEIGGNGTADMRIASVSIRNAAGNAVTDFRYVSHRIFDGKPELPGLPSLYEETQGDCQTLEILTRDDTTLAECVLRYTVYEKHPALTRSLTLRNSSDKEMEIERVMSLCLDMNSADFDLVTLYGRHNQEREFSRRPLAHGLQGIASRRGSSSHQQNPFMALISRGGGEDHGEAYGFHLVYSANFLGEMEVDYNRSTRVILGINPADFGWKLAPGEEFTAPEAVLVFSAEGLGGMSRAFHRLYNHNLIRGAWKTKKRPLLVNNWEGTGMDFDDDKLFAIAKWAAETGIEMFVMDDGWFGRRDDDTSSLGDWYVDEKKFHEGLGRFIDRVVALGLRFGIWFEPEMISPDSDLFRAHPDWAIGVPDRRRSEGRQQYVLDMTRQDVRDYLFERMSDILGNNRISYLKWDFNRNITEPGSALLPPERQKEFYHRYILGTYELMGRIVKAFPELLVENCSGGGGRYDPGMLAFSPQIWCSDNTDAVERLEIQRGTSYGYPPCTMGAHVSACPNHQTGRTVPLATRGIVAQAGTFGYELDPAKLTEDEKKTVKEQIAAFHRYETLNAGGDYYRLDESEGDWTAWMTVSPDRKEALVSVAATHVRANGPFPFIRLQGLDPERIYCREDTGEKLTGAALMYGGISLPQFAGDYPATQIYFNS